MRTDFRIQRPDDAILPALRAKIDDLTKPKGSLGRLEELALQVGWIQQTLSPSLRNPHNIVFAGDHGIAAEGVSLSPAEVTRQMISNFLDGGAGINFLARQHGFLLKVVDSGVDFDFPPIPGMIHMKVRRGTRNFLHEPAMTEEEAQTALERGSAVVSECYEEGCNVIAFGEMGIANTSASSMWMHCLTGIALERCVGAGCGLDDEGVRRKYGILKKAMDNYTGITPADALRWFGGYEMVMAVGGMLRAAELGMVILIDGFIMTNCLLMASRLSPEVIHYALFGHQGDEAGHRLLLEHLGAKPILHLGMRLGEGTGAICAYPIVDSALRMLNEMSSFSGASVTKYF